VGHRPAGGKGCHQLDTGTGEPPRLPGSPISGPNLAKGLFTERPMPRACDRGVHEGGFDRSVNAEPVPTLCRDEEADRGDGRQEV
jgi:hypothetical protein